MTSASTFRTALLLSESNYQAVAWSWIGLALVAFVALFWVTAPFGRHLRSGWGPAVPARWAWVMMESPALWWVGFLVAGRLQGPAIAIATMWFLHYGYRILVYPFRLSSNAKPIPVTIMTMAFTFQLVSGWLIASRLVAPWGGYPESWWTDPRLWIGIAVAVCGAWINHRSDAILRHLSGQRRRESGARGYQIPRGFLYRLVSCPNYLGEVIEWIGWAITGWSLAGAAFAVWTFANLVPRSLAHHRWYQEKFADYPRQRRAIFPGLL